MSQTLTVLAATNFPPLITDSNTLVKDMAALENLARKQLKAIAILGMIHSLTPTPDYRTDHPALIQAAQTFLGGISNFDDVDTSKQSWLLLAVLSWDAGVGVDPTLSSDVNTLLNEARDLIELPEELLTRIFFTLFYDLTV